jgi:putative ABC transport system permease protein
MPGAELDAGSMDSFYALDSVALRLHLLMPGLATLSVLLLSAGGISAMMSFAVTHRQREVGIRTALGASQRQVMASIFWRSIRQLGIGLLFGVVAAVVLDRLTSREYLGNEAISLLAIVVAIVFVSGLLVTLGPARRALRIEPTEAMRAE